MSATEYHRWFTNLSRYCPKTIANPWEMLRLFKRELARNVALYGQPLLPVHYQEFFEILLRSLMIQRMLLR